MKPILILVSGMLLGVVVTCVVGYLILNPRHMQVIQAVAVVEVEGEITQEILDSFADRVFAVAEGVEVSGVDSAVTISNGLEFEIILHGYYQEIPFKVLDTIEDWIIREIDKRKLPIRIIENSCRQLG